MVDLVLEYERHRSAEIIVWILLQTIIMRLQIDNGFR